MGLKTASKKAREMRDLRVIAQFCREGVARGEKVAFIRKIADKNGVSEFTVRNILKKKGLL